ncbi:GDP dissociation inhibitor-domain-containing protein [Lentinula edodes]|uniref:GDP dissociation inhibitor-domain-containing protein n=1 Tax=Lentinula edodes TaxID=5353 RepID=UPI001E8DA354|nr:GDP dissociation inhibitor-domain-containing protein [Lentinula edodes]KAH7875878.1 GDP dissociation inhibitor-domain-containing protein [Lentinula edodes]
MDDEGAFDVIVIGTGLTESITAAALAKAGFKVAHLDENVYYGGDEASLSLDEYIDWATQPKTSTQFSSFSSLSPSDTLPDSRQYSISLSPSVIPATGPLISSLVASGVSRYGGFRLVEHVAVYSSDHKVKTVPGSKEDIFKDKTISLLDKRRLMRFLVFASGDEEFEGRVELEGTNVNMPFLEFLKATFSLNQEIAETITYALSYCTSPTDKTLPALHRLRRYLRSTGRYGHSPFLIGHYGSSGEIAQGFCRTAAVAGAVYILGKPISSITRNRNSEKAQSTPTYTLTLADFPEPITCHLLISSESRLPVELIRNIDAVQRIPSAFPFADEDSPIKIARGVCVIDQPLTLTPTQDSLISGEADPESNIPESRSALDTGIVVFPPFSVPAGFASSAVTVLVVGEGSFSVPKGKWIIYISTPMLSSSPDSNNNSDPVVSPETLLKPYLEATLSFSSTSSVKPLIPLFTSFYLQSTSPSPRAASVTPSAVPTDLSASLEVSNSIDPPSPSILLMPLPVYLPLPDSGDASALNAETVFREAIKALNRFKHTKKQEASQEQDAPPVREEDKLNIESFWPPVVSEEDDEDE